MEHNSKLLTGFESELIQLTNHVASLKNSGQVSPLEHEWLKSKIVQLFDLVKKINCTDSVTEHVTDNDTKVEIPEIPVEKEPTKPKSDKKQQVKNIENINIDDIKNFGDELKEIVSKEAREHKIIDLEGLNTNDPVNLIEKADKKILAEKFASPGKSLYESMGEKTRPSKGLYEQIQATAVKSITQSIGINDKFLFVKELFKGDANAFQKTINNLDQASSFDELYDYVKNNFEWDTESEHVQRLLGIAKRKFTDDKK